MTKTGSNCGLATWVARTRTRTRTTRTRVLGERDHTAWRERLGESRDEGLWSGYLKGGTQGEARGSRRRSNGGRDDIEEDTRKRGQKGKLIGSLETRTTSEGDGLARSQGTSLATSRSREAGGRGELKKLVGELRDQTRRGAKQEFG